MTKSESDHVVVVGVDGSTNSIAAVKWAEQYAKAMGSTLRAVIAWEWPTSYGQPIGFDGYSPEADARAMAEKAVAEVDLPADRVELEVVQGFGGPVLVRASENADLLVVGSHGHSAVVTAILGSVSAHCVHHSTVPVVVVR